MMLAVLRYVALKKKESNKTKDLKLKKKYKVTLLAVLRCQGLVRELQAVGVACEAGKVLRGKVVALMAP